MLFISFIYGVQSLLKNNDADNNLSSIMKHAFIVFGLAMLIHSFLYVIFSIPLPQTVFQILKTFSITLINDVAFLIDLIRGHYPIEYSPIEILILGIDKRQHGQ